MDNLSRSKILEDFARLSYVTEKSCHQWLGKLDISGYAMYQTPTCSSIKAYRLIYRLLRGEIPNFYHVHHICHNRACVNVLHLEAIHRDIHKLAHIIPFKGEEFMRLFEELPDKLYSEAKKYFGL